MLRTTVLLIVENAWLWGLLTLLLLCTVSLVSPALFQVIVRKLGRWFWVLLALGIISDYGIILGLRLQVPDTIDWTETATATVSYWLLHGHPLYSGADDASRYSLLYGPSSYMVYALVIWVLGATMASLKLALAFFNACVLAVLWQVFRRTLNRCETLVAVGYIISMLAMTGQRTTFMIRGDVLLILAVAVSLFASNVQRRLPAILLFSFAAAFAVDVKITAIFYLFVPFYLLWRRHRKAAGLLASASVLMLAMLPFASPAISFRNYVFWLRAATHHPRSVTLFFVNVVGLVFILFPLVCVVCRFCLADSRAAAQYFRRERMLWILFAFSAALTTFTASKVGAGLHHLSGTLVISSYLAAELWTKVRTNYARVAFLYCVSAAYGVFLLVFMTGAAWSLRTLWKPVRPYQVAVKADIAKILREHSGRSIEMGNSESVSDSTMPDQRTRLVAELVFAGNPLTIDPAALADMELARLAMPSATVDYVKSCEGKIWLIPRNGTPFSTTNLYALENPKLLADPHLYSKEFRDAFFATYHKAEASGYYDLWECDT
jgi:hypothetical protein